MNADIYREAWERALTRLDTSGSCWLWTGATTGVGYGQISVGNRVITTHRLSVLASGREIPEGMHIDHRCHVTDECFTDARCPHRRCANPDHLFVVTRSENIRRIWESGLCKKGHPLTPLNNGTGWRVCVTCRCAARRRLHAARTSQAAS